MKGVPYSLQETSGQYRIPCASAASCVPSSLPKRMISHGGSSRVQLRMAFCWIVAMWLWNGFGVVNSVINVFLPYQNDRYFNSATPSHSAFGSELVVGVPRHIRVVFSYSASFRVVRPVAHHMSMAYNSAANLRTLFDVQCRGLSLRSPVFHSVAGLVSRRIPYKT